MIIKKSLLLLFVLLVSILSNAQQGDGGSIRSSKLFLNSKSLQTVQFAKPNIKALRLEDQINDAQQDSPWRFGFNNYTTLNQANAGAWYDIPTGKVWLLQLTCEEALTVNLTFDNTVIPEGNELFIYNPQKSFILGKFTARHLYEGQLGAELVPGNTVVVEYFVSNSNYQAGQLGNVEISTVTHGYRTAQEFTEKAFGSSGSCNMNVACPDGAPHENEIRATMMLVSGSNGFCTGSMINNCNSDGTPYVLTANHCYSNPANWIFRFNWQSATCSNPGSSPSFESLSGAVLRARRTPSDMCLVEITGGLENGTVPLAYNTYFPGWDHSDTPPTSAVCVHHPSGDIKKISFDDNPLNSGNGMGSTEANSQWVLQWDRNTTTEPGSSGSPLFDQNGRIVGQLWGGGASCSSLNSPDYYGKVSYSWNPSGSNSTNHLVTWLDPCNSGANTIDGYDPNQPSVANDAKVSDLQGVSGVICGNGAQPIVKLTNKGTQNLVSALLTINYNGTNSDINWSGNLATNQFEDIQLPWMFAVNGQNTIEVTVSNPNGLVDENPANNLINSSYNAVIEGEWFTLDLTLDCYAEEITWNIVDVNGATWYNGGGYQNPTPLNQTQQMSESFCLAEGCYNLVLNDSYGDGMGGAQWTPDCDFDGSMQLSRSTNGTVVAELLAQDADFGFSISYNFCAQNLANLSSLTKNEQLIIYPNPSSNFFTIQMPGLMGNKLFKLADTSGKIIISREINSNQVTFSNLNLQSGIYLINVISDSIIATGKLVIQ